MNAHDVIKIFQLQKHPREDGWFIETYRSEERNAAGLPSRYEGERCFSTAILFLIESGKFSAWHRLQSEEIFHFYMGGPAELLVIHPSGRLESRTLGTQIDSGQVVQAVVPRGAWQALRLKPGVDWVLVGCTVAPGFEYNDYEDGQEEELLRAFPQHSELISQLVKKS